LYITFTVQRSFIQTNLLVLTAYRTDIQDEVVELEISLVPACTDQSAYDNEDIYF